MNLTNPQLTQLKDFCHYSFAWSAERMELCGHALTPKRETYISNVHIIEGFNHCCPDFYINTAHVVEMFWVQHWMSLSLCGPAAGVAGGTISNGPWKKLEHGTVRKLP